MGVSMSGLRSVDLLVPNEISFRLAHLPRLTVAVIAAEFAGMLKSLLAVGVMGWCLVSVPAGNAADWPRWRGPDGSGHVPAGINVPASLPNELKPVWKIDVGEGVSSPVISGGWVVFMEKRNEKEVLTALNAENGNRVWSEVIDDSFEDTQGIGPRCTPLVDGDRVYAQSRKGELHCRRIVDGRILWRKNFVRDFEALFIGEKSDPVAVGAIRHGYNGSPVIDGDGLIVIAGGTNNASVVKLIKQSGTTIWKSQSDAPGYAPATIATIGGVKQAVVFTADGVIGLKLADGNLLWRFPIKTTWARHVTTPTIAGDLVMVSSHQHGLFGIRIAKDGTGQKAEQAWLTKDAAINFSSPVIVGQHLYGLGPAKNLICVETQTGKIAWSKDGYITTSGGQAHAAFVVMGKNILTLTDGGELVLFPADPVGFKQISRVQICGSTWCNPAYSDGKLFVRDGIGKKNITSHLLCVDLLKK